MAFFENVLNSGKAVGQKAKLKADILLLDRNIVSRKKVFGIELYNDLSDLTCQQHFYAVNDPIIAAIRPELLALDREIRALDGKKLHAKGNLDLAQAMRREAFPVAATNLFEKASNASKKAGMVANEAKIMTELKVISGHLNALKEGFGIKIFPILQKLFGLSSGPRAVRCDTDIVANQIRERYESCKDDLIQMNRKRIQMDAMIDQLGVEASLRRIGK